MYRCIVCNNVGLFPPKIGKYPGKCPFCGDDLINIETQELFDGDFSKVDYSKFKGVIE